MYWEQFEPQPGKFDYTVMDTLLTQARQHHVRLVLLWFGLYKNGSQHYTPEWMKLDPDRYEHIMVQSRPPGRLSVALRARTARRCRPRPARRAPRRPPAAGRRPAGR